MSTSKIHPLWFIAAGGLITWYAWGLPDNKIGLICAAFITAWPFVIRASDWLAVHVYRTQSEAWPGLTPAEIAEMGRIQEENFEESTRDWLLGNGAWSDPA